MKQLLTFILVILSPLQGLSQVGVLARGNVKGSGNLVMASAGSGPATDFFAQLPINWVNSGLSTGTGFCSPPGGTFDAIKTIKTGTFPANGADYPATFQGLIDAKNDQVTANKWWKLVIDAGLNIHGSTYDSNNALLSWPAGSATVTKCLVIRSSNPTTNAQIVCAHGLPGYGGTRDPLCSTDGAKLWKFTIDSTPQTGFTGMLFRGPNGSALASNYILVQDMELTVTPGSMQSVNGVNVIIQLENDGDHTLIANSWIHGWDMGDPGQPAGACSAWNRLGTVTSSGSTVTWNAQLNSTDTRTPASIKKSNQFGMDFSDGTNSVGYPQVTAGGANRLRINGVNYTITSHDPSVSATVMTVSPAIGTNASPVDYDMTNPSTTWANGCGDDTRGVQMNCTNCGILYSQVNKIHWYGNESHAISSGFAAGPIKYVWLWVESGASGLFWGGAPLDTRGGPMSDVEVGNVFVGRDLSMRLVSASAGNSPSPPWGCGPLDGVSAHDTCVLNYAYKNAIELKQCNRCLFYSVIVDGSWPDGQSGYAILLNVRTASGGQIAGIYDPSTGLPWTSVTNVRFQDCWVRNTPQAVQMSPRALGSGNGGGSSMPLSNVDWINCVFSNIGSGPQFGTPGGDIFQWLAGGQTFLADMTRTSNVAHAVVRPNKITNVDLDNNNAGTYSNAMDVDGVIRTGSTVTIQLSRDRHDPTVGGSVTVGTQDWMPATRFTNTRVQPTVNNAGNFIFSTPATASNAETGATMNWSTCQTTSSTCTDNSGPDQIVWTNTGLTGNGYDGTFTIASVAQDDTVTTACSQNNFFQSVSASVATQPQPCIRADGTFGDTIFYTSAGTGTALCTSAATCNTSGVKVTMDTLAYKVSSISIGEGVYVHDCTGGSGPATYEAGSTTFNPALSPTNPAGLDVYYTSSGSNDSSGTVCQLENSQGLPQNFTLQHLSILSDGNVAIQSNGIPGQHHNNIMLHNVFATTGTAVNLICTGVSGEGTAATKAGSKCWDNNSATPFQFDDNVLVGRSTSNWIALPSGTVFTSPSPAAVTCSGATAVPGCMGWAGYMSGVVFPTTDPANSLAPYNTPLMAAPWSSNFDLTKIAPVATSSYANEGADIPTMTSGFARTQYQCPVGADCGSPGPYPD